MSLFLRVLLIIGALSVPFSASAAEAVKLRHVVSVYADEKGAGLHHPEGVACNERTLLVVGDTGNGRLVRFTFQEGGVKGGTEIRVPQLSNPIRVQVNSKGDIFALDGKSRRIVRLGPDGTFKGYVAAEGASPSAMVPKSFKVDRDDAIYVLDVFSARVLVLNADGKFLKQIEFPKEYGFITDLAVDPKGNVLLVDPVKGRVFSAAKNSAGFSPLGGPMKEQLSFPANLTTDVRGTLYITDENGGAVGILSQDGAFLGKQLSMGWNEGLLYYPAQVCVNEKGETFIADRGNSRLQVFTPVK
jgi:DNA-binding beta-propeller fold protein YncE